MAKLYFILFTAVALQCCVKAAQINNGHHGARKSEQIRSIELDNFNLDDELYGTSENNKDVDEKSIQGQRKKRFDNYFNFGFSSFYPFFSSYETPGYPKGIAGITENKYPWSYFVKYWQAIIGNTRRQANSPIIPIPIPSYVPVYFAPDSCGCTDDTNNPPNDELPNQDRNNQKPGIEQKPSIDQGPVIGSQEPSDDDGLDLTPDAELSSETEEPIVPINTPISTTNTAQTVSPQNTVNSSPSSQSPDDAFTPGFVDRLSDNKDDNDNDDEEGDGSRPISFVPIMPKKPLSKPPPPVDHGSSQAGNQETPAAVTTTTTARPPPVRRYPALPNLPTNAIPTLCDGAVLTCCHQPEVTYDCFSLQGCPEPSGSDNPCNEKIILKVINKFQYYYANRQG